MGNTKKIKTGSNKTWKEFTKSTVDNMPAKDFEGKKAKSEVIEINITAEIIRLAAADVLAGFTILELANKYGIEEIDAADIYNAVANRIDIINSED